VNNLRRTRKSRVLKNKKKSKLKVLSAVSFTIVLTLSGSLTTNAATIDDLRDLLNQPRTDQKFSAAEQYKIELEYTKIESHNRVAKMFSSVAGIDLDSEVTKTRLELEKEATIKKEVLLTSFSSGLPVESIVVVKSDLSNLQYKLSRLKEKGVELTLEVIENTWDEKYTEMMSIWKEIEGYQNIGDVGIALKSPVRGSFSISSVFGQRISPINGVDSTHNGLDLRGAIGTDVLSTWKGTVSNVYESARGGKTIEIDHGNRLKTRYLHLSETLVVPGQPVSQYDLVGKVGDTGEVTGPHLHLEVIIDGVPVNPVYFFGAYGANALKAYASGNVGETRQDMDAIVTSIKNEPEHSATSEKEDALPLPVKSTYVKTGETVKDGLEIQIVSGHKAPSPSDKLVK
jgi:murein DD-endopeptidase MepM/ murein hydrolase activator NlpD